MSNCFLNSFIGAVQISKQIALLLLLETNQRRMYTSGFGRISRRSRVLQDSLSFTVVALLAALVVVIKCHITEWLCNRIRWGSEEGIGFESWVARCNVGSFMIWVFPMEHVTVRLLN